MANPSESEKRSLPEEGCAPFKMASTSSTSTTTDEDHWTATSLVSALVELLIAFLFLAGATISYLTSKCIRFFALQPPCFDRGATGLVRRSCLQKIMGSDRPPNELCEPSHCFLRERHMSKGGACGTCPPKTSCSQIDSLSSREYMKRSHSFTCRRCALQSVRNRSSCASCRDRKRREKTNSDEVARSNGCKGREIGPYSFHSQCSGFRGSIQRRQHRRSINKRPDGMIPEDYLDLCRDSDDDSIGSAEAEAVHQLEKEHSLKVFPEDLIDFHSWSQENEGKGIAESSQDFSGHGSIHRADSTQALETSIQKYPDERENAGRTFSLSGLQLTGEYLGSHTDPLVPKVEFEGAKENIQSSDSRETEKQSVLKAEEPGFVFVNGFDKSDQCMLLLDNGNPINYSTIPGDEGLKNLCSGVNDHSIKLKEKLALERATLNRIYLELEKERTASASAADEAMAMITRLQKDKAALKLEAVQYQRMAEEKARYDEQAIFVLRDFLLKREAEKLCLEKEIEFYRRKFFTSRIKSATRIEPSETADALSWEDDDKDMYPLLESKEVEENADVDTGVCPRLWKRGSSYAELSGHKHFSTKKSETLLEAFNPVHGNSSTDGLEKQDNCMSIFNDVDLSPTSGKNDNDRDQSNSFQAAARYDRSYSSLRANRHELRPGTPETETEADDEDQSNDVETAALYCRLHSPMRVNEHEIRFGPKSRVITQRHWQHILERIWNLEEQIHRLKTKHNLSIELSLGAHSGHGMKQKPFKEQRKTLDDKISQCSDSSAKLSVCHRNFEANDHGKVFIRANASEDSVSPRFANSSRAHNVSIANGTPASLSLTSHSLAMNLSDEIEGGIQVCRESSEQIRVPNAFFELEVPLMEAESLTQEPLAASPSPILCSSLKPESLPSDRRTTDDDVKKESSFSSSGGALSNFRDTLTSSESKTVFKDEVQEFVSKLQVLEADRKAMRQIMESMRKERNRMELLEQGGQQMDLLHETDGSGVCDRAAPETFQEL